MQSELLTPSNERVLQGEKTRDSTTSLLGEEAIRLWPRIVSEQKSYREKVVWWKYTLRHGECIRAIKKSVIWNTSGSIFLL